MAKPLQFTGVYGSTSDILLAMFGPKQYDSHVHRYRLDQRDRRLAKNLAIVSENLRLGRPKWEGVQ